MKNTVNQDFLYWKGNSNSYEVCQWEMNDWGFQKASGQGTEAFKEPSKPIQMGFSQAGVNMLWRVSNVNQKMNMLHVSILTASVGKVKRHIFTLH